MKKEYVLKNKIKFNEVIKKGKKVKNDTFVLYFLPNFKLKIGITIGTKLGKANFRNYHKRVIRHLCRDNIDSIKPGFYVLIGREGIKNIEFEQKEKKLLELFERI